MRVLPALITIVICILKYEYISAAEEFNTLKWRNFGNLKSPRYGFSIQPIFHDQIMVCGGLITPFRAIANDRVDNVVSRCEIIDMTGNRIISATNMNYPRAYFSTLLTKDSNIVVISGITGTNGWKLTPTCELYDRKSKTWKLLGNLLQGRWRSSAEWISDTEFIVVGGMDENEVSRQTAELFNIQTGISISIANFYMPHNNGAAIRTLSGTTLFFGGRAGGAGSLQSNSIVTYNRTSNEWVQVGTIPMEASDPAVVKLENGKHVYFGGYHENPRQAVDIIAYENNNSFIEIGKLLSPRHLLGATQITDSCVIVISGLNPPQKAFRSTEIVNIYTGNVMQGPDLQYGRLRHYSGSLRNSKKEFLIRKAFAIGGITQSDSATSSVEILEIDTMLIINPPVIVSDKLECGLYTVEISDNIGISDIKFDEQITSNCSFQLSSVLPAKKVIVTILLENDSQSGKFKLLIKNSGNKTVSIENTIKPKSPLELILDKKNIPIYRDSIPIESLQCVSLPLKNNSVDTVNVESMYMIHNTYFSIPETTKRKYLFPNETINIKICYTTPTSFIGTIDTLIIGSECYSIRHPFIVNGLPLSEIDNGMCNIPFSITQYVSNQTNFPTLLLGENYVMIDIKSNPNPIEVNVYDVYGTLYSAHYRIIRSANRDEMRIDVSDCSSGIYYIVLNYGDGFYTIPVIVKH